VIPTILSQLFSYKETLELGALSPTRDLNYVSNTVSAFLAAARSDQSIGEVINFGSGREISIEELAKLLMQLTGIDKPLVSTAERQRPGASEVDRLCCDASKAKALLGWEPALSLEQGLELTIAWMREHLQYYRPESYTV
jgi:dTDP-glucose 4,6-dehydratase